MNYVKLKSKKGNIEHFPDLDAIIFNRTKTKRQETLNVDYRL